MKGSAPDSGIFVASCGFEAVPRAFPQRGRPSGPAGHAAGPHMRHAPYAGHARRQDPRAARRLPRARRPPPAGRDRGARGVRPEVPDPALHIEVHGGLLGTPRPGEPLPAGRAACAVPASRFRRGARLRRYAASKWRRILPSILRRLASASSLPTSTWFAATR